MPAERALHRLRRLALLEREDRGAESLRQVGLGHRAEVDRRAAGLLLHGGGEVGALGEAVGQRLGGGFVGQHDLAQAAALRRRQLVAARLEGLGDLLFGNGDAGGGRLHAQHHQDDVLVGRRHQRVAGGGVNLLQGRRLGRAEIGDAVVGDAQVVGDAALLAVAEEALGQAAGRRGGVGDGGDQLLAHDVAADLRQVSLLAEAGVVQGLGEAIAVEAPAGALEVGIAQQVLAHLLLGHQHAHPRGHLVQHGAGDHALQHLLGDAEGARLVHGELHAEPAAHGVDLVRQLARELALLDDGVADLRHRLGVGAAAEHVADAPDSEAEDQQAEQDAGDDLDN